MSFIKILANKRNLYHRLFSYDDEDRNNIDEIIVHPSRSDCEPSTSAAAISDSFQPVKNLLHYIETPFMKNLLNDSKKVLILKLKIATKPHSAEINELSQKCLKNSIVVLLATEDESKFLLYWKSKEIGYFFTFKIYDGADFMNDIKLFEFIADFLGDSLMQGFLGIHSKFSTSPGASSLELHLLADHRDYNLLLIAAEVGDVYIVKFLLAIGLNSEFCEINAQTLAWKNRNFEVLSLLLKYNLSYPQSMAIDECPNDIKEFYEVSHELDKAILMRDGTKVSEILTQNTGMIHFYNLNNESALAFALKHRLFDMYSLLISKNIMFGPHERFSEIKEEMKESDREKLREIHYQKSKFLPDNHMHVLLSNSRLGHDTSNAKTKYEIIQKAFEILNENPFIQIILMIVAASRNFLIIFDFNRDSVEVVDPTADEATTGLFYFSGRIYIGARKLMNPDTEYEALGTLAHELCHFAMSLVYKNSAKPYLKNDDQTEKEFQEIMQNYKENVGKEEIVDLVHKCYSPALYHAELIVRVPHLIMQYLNNPRKFNTVREIFIELFDIFETKIFLEMKEALPRIEDEIKLEAAKNQKKVKKMKVISIVIGFLAIVGIVGGVFITLLIFYKPNYKFSALSRDDQIRVENAHVIYKQVDIVFHDLFPVNSTAYDLLTSDDISKMLDDIPLDFSDPHLLYLDKLIAFTWFNLTGNLRDKLLNSNFNFQNETVRFKILNNSDSNALSSLNSQQIIDVLDGIVLHVHKMITNETQFYVERDMFTEYIYKIYYLFMIKLNGGREDWMCHYENITGTSNETFEKFYQNFTNQDFHTIINITDGFVKNHHSYLRCSPADFQICDPNTGNVTESLLAHNMLQLGFEDVLKETFLSSTRIFILSADAGTGKTETFQQFTMRIKKTFPTRWVSYIDFSFSKNFHYKTIKTLDDVRKILEVFFNLSGDNEFERKIFEEFFHAGKVVLLWDGFDQISSDQNSIVLEMLGLINNQTSNIQFVSTRPLIHHQLRDYFKFEPYTLVPFDENHRIIFLREFFLSQNIEESKIPVYIKKVQKIVKTNELESYFNTPLLLGMIAYVIKNDPNIFAFENLYDLYRIFIEMKIQIWVDKSEYDKEFIKSVLITGFSIPKFYQRYALMSRFEFPNMQYAYFLSLKLQVMHTNLPKEVKTEDISRIGILNVKGRNSFRFASETFAEFFIAQYLIENIYNADDGPSEQEAYMRIQTFYTCTKYSVISKFISSYLQTVSENKTEKFDSQISAMFRKKFSNIFIRAIQSPKESFPLYFNFFKKDRKLLTDLLKVGESEGFYPSTYNYVYIESYNYYLLNRSAIRDFAIQYLTKDEYEKFISCEYQRGIILYSMYCVKQFSNSSENARKFFPEYNLSDEILNSFNVSYVLQTIANNLTRVELKKLLTSKPVWYPLMILQSLNDTKCGDGDLIDVNGYICRTENDLNFFIEMWDLIENNLSKDEQKSWITKKLKFIFFLQNETTRNFLLSKVDKLLSNIEIFNTFSKSNILFHTTTIGNAYYDYNRLNYSWNFFVNHTNQKQQKDILKVVKEPECYINERYIDFCYLVPKTNLLQASLVEEMGYDGYNSFWSFHEMLEIYKKYFINTELQELITTGPKDFIPFLVIEKYPYVCKTYADFLRHVFKGNESSLKEFLLEAVEPTKLNIFDLLAGFDDPLGNIIFFRNLLDGVVHEQSNAHKPRGVARNYLRGVR